MSANEQNEYEREERLLQWCLEPSSMTEEDQRTLESDPKLQAELNELTGTLSGLRSDLAAEEAERDLSAEASPALVDSILANTTREDLSWRGDLRLVRDFAGRQVKNSWILKFVAASLLLHLTALPIVAYMNLAKPAEPRYTLYWEKQKELPFVDSQPEPDREVLDPEALDPTVEDELLKDW